MTTEERNAMREQLFNFAGLKHMEGQIHTPRKIAIQMIECLPESVWNADTTFLDPATKSGVFLLEIYKKLMNSSDLQLRFPDPDDREQHILQNQLFGIATDELGEMFINRIIYLNIPEETHIKYIRDYSRKTSNEWMAMLKKEFNRENMKFDVVIGNPPYNKGLDIDFVANSFDISNQYVCMITPAKWQTAATDQRITSSMSYGQFREKIVPHMSYVCFYPDCKDIFDIGQIDGNTWYLVDKNKKKEDTCIVENRCKMQKYFNSVKSRQITHGESLNNIGQEIISCLGKYNHFVFPIVKEERYEVWTNTQMASGSRDGMTSCLLTTDGNSQFIGVSNIRDNLKDAVPKSSTAKIVYSSSDKKECESFLSWIDTKFVRFFLAVNIGKLSNIICEEFFRFVPAPPSGQFDHIYTDEELYRAFNLPQKYVDVIEAVVRSRR